MVINQGLLMTNECKLFVTTCFLAFLCKFDITREYIHAAGFDESDLHGELLDIITNKCHVGEDIIHVSFVWSTSDQRASYWANMSDNWKDFLHIALENFNEDIKPVDKITCNNIWNN